MRLAGPNAFLRHPVGVVIVHIFSPRVARSSQPWALRRNPFGIPGPMTGDPEFKPLEKEIKIAWLR
jgi:hypothetical protein